MLRIGKPNISNRNGKAVGLPIRKKGIRKNL